VVDWSEARAGTKGIYWGERRKNGKREMKEFWAVVILPCMFKVKKMKSFLLSVKPAILAEEKVPALGLEPVGQFLPFARFKSRINLVQDTAE